MFCSRQFLLRGFRAAILDKYPLFYIQAAFVLFSFTLLYFYDRRQPALYARAYWPLQFLTMLVACGMILEILRQGLFPLERSRQCTTVIRGALFLAIACFVIVYVVVNLKNLAMEETLIGLERDFRAGQALLLLGIGGVIVYHRVPLGRNLKSMLIGYGLYVGTSLIILALRVYMGLRINAIWHIIQPLSYDVGLVVWTVGLWSYFPPATPRANTKTETKSHTASIMRWPASGSVSQ